MTGCYEGGITITQLEAQDGEGMILSADNGTEVRFLRQGAGGACLRGTAVRLVEQSDGLFSIKVLSVSGALELIGQNAKVVLHEDDYDKLVALMSEHSRPITKS